MSEQQLADKLGMKRPYLNAISCGRKNVTIEQLERIAEGLGMTLHIHRFLFCAHARKSL